MKAYKVTGEKNSKFFKEMYQTKEDVNQALSNYYDSVCDGASISCTIEYNGKEVAFMDNNYIIIN